MRRTVSSLVLGVLAALTLAPTASAAEPRTQFIDFRDTFINGNVRSPGANYFNGKNPAIFERMLKLRKDMLPGIEKARHERVFK